MVLDQNEIDALLADVAVAPAEEEAPASEPDAPETAVAVEDPPAEPPAPTRDLRQFPPEIRRLLRLKVPVIVQLASKRVTIAQARRISQGMIIEFEKSVDEPLNLAINNCPIGDGSAVKVGDHFGLRIREMRSRAHRIRSMGC